MDLLIRKVPCDGSKIFAGFKRQCRPHPGVSPTHMGTGTCHPMSFTTHLWRRKTSAPPPFWPSQTCVLLHANLHDVNLMQQLRPKRTGQRRTRSKSNKNPLPVEEENIRTLATPPFWPSRTCVLLHANLHTVSLMQHVRPKRTGQRWPRTNPVEDHPPAGEEKPLHPRYPAVLALVDMRPLACQPARCKLDAAAET